MNKFRYLALFVLMFAAFTMPAVTQGTCRAAAQDAAVLLDQALEALTAGDSALAETLITQARERLALDCGNVQPPQPTAEPTSDASVASPRSSEGDFTVSAPEVSVDESISFVRFAHTGIDSGPLDFYIRAFGQTPVVANLAFGEATGLIAISAGAHDITARPAGSGPDGDALSTLNWDFVGNSTWSVTASGLLSTVAFLVEPVTIIRTPLNGKARIRIVNWVAGAERLSVTGEDGGTYADRIGWVGVADREIDPGTDTLHITGVDGTPYGEPTVFDFAPDTVYMLLLAGSKDGEPPVRFLTIETPQDQTRVRFVNNRGDAVDIHARPGNALIVSALAPDSTTDWIAIPSAAATFVAYVPGTGPTGQEQAALSTQLRPGRDITIVLRPNGDMLIRDVALTPN